MIVELARKQKEIDSNVEMDPPVNDIENNIQLY
jgi:hypothetical protein